MTKQSVPFVVLSPDSSRLNDDENGQSYAVLRSGLRRAGLDFGPVYGSCEGKPEHGFLVLLPEGDGGPGFDTVLDLAARTDQDSVLYVGADRIAALVGVRDRVYHPAGRWQQVPYVGERPSSYTVGPDGRIYAAL